MYRLKKALVAVSRDKAGDPIIITLGPGSIVQHPHQSEPLMQSGLIDVVVNGEHLSVFMQDLQARGERVASATS